MKIKIIYILLGAFLIYCNNEKRKTEKSLVSKSPNIVLIDIEGLDKEDVGKLLIYIKNCNAKVIGINKFFEMSEYSKGDSILSSSIKSLENVVFVQSTNKQSVISSSNLFTKNSLDSGLIGFNYDENGVYYKLTIPIEDKMYWSFAFTIAARFKDGLASKIMTKYLPNTYYNLDLKRRSKNFEIIEDLNDSNTLCQKLNNKIILLGDLGSSNRVTLRNTEFNEPITVVIASIIESIIYSELSESKGFEVD
jgi:hypothetical protein